MEENNMQSILYIVV